jgi:hypothetical protein
MIIKLFCIFESKKKDTRSDTGALHLFTTLRYEATTNLHLLI